ncbi:hypothetical protein [Tropicibacter alexandrii]|uniref:hypothetical protein n=1 Tax=Tropicibacter alexandrii TaxID=2267683 RepID=UPI000EF50800|nr:hypothetical protein [Tropicibacter alexandrii]
MSGLKIALALALCVSVLCALVFFLQAIARLSSFTHALRKSALDEPEKAVLTGGYYNAFRVWFDSRNTHARNQLLRYQTRLVLAVAISAALGTAMMIVGELNKPCLEYRSYSLNDGRTIQSCLKK